MSKQKQEPSPAAVAYSKHLHKRVQDDLKPLIFDGATKALDRKSAVVQVANEAGVSVPTVAQIVNRYGSGVRTIDVLAKVAHALNCDVQITFVPKKSRAKSRV